MHSNQLSPLDTGPDDVGDLWNAWELILTSTSRCRPGYRNKYLSPIHF